MTETLLEMYYFRSFLDAFANVFGAREYKAFKPSTQREAWLGFDQAWVATQLEEDEFFRSVTDYNNNDTELKNIIFAFFLQYKVVQKLTHGRLLYRPPGFRNPYYKVPISLTPNNQNHLSQHECLVKLSRLPNSQVDYVCPMLFPPLDIYAEPNVNDLQFVTVNENEHNYANNETHSINFQTQNSQPVWNSEPIDGKSLNFIAFAQQKFHKYNPETLKGYLIDCRNVLVNSKTDYKTKLCKNLPSALTIISLKVPERITNDVDPYGEENW